MFIRIENMILNTDHIVRVRIQEPTGDNPLFVGVDLATPLSDRSTTVGWSGREAEILLAAIPAYTPIMDDEEEES